MVVKRKSKEQEDDKNPIDGIRMSELLTDMRLWKNKQIRDLVFIIVMLFTPNCKCYSGINNELS